MNFFLLDASGLAKRYSLEHGVDRVDHLFGGVARERLTCLTLGVAEVVSVLVRRRNGGLLTAAAFAQAMTNLKAEVIDAADFNTLPIEDEDILASLALIEKHSINSADAALLYLCLKTAAPMRARGDDLVLIVADKRLLKAAQAEGLLTFNPDTQTQTELDTLIGP